MERVGVEDYFTVVGRRSAKGRLLSFLMGWFVLLACKASVDRGSGFGQ